MSGAMIGKHAVRRKSQRLSCTIHKVVATA
jgi:hypothetical protein